MFWQQLGNAGMIPGSYLGYFPLPSGPSETVGVNIPASRADANAGFSLFYVCATDVFFTPGCGHTLFYGAQSPTAEDNWTDFAMYPTLTALDAQRIDTKIDDGRPGTGSVTALPDFTYGGLFTPNCATTTNPDTAIYATTTTSGPQCSLIFSGI